jgi:hypothetical protein
MCHNANQLISNLMVVERPTLVAIMTDAGVSTAQQTTVLAAYDQAQESAANWQPGDSVTEVNELLNAALAEVVALKNLVPANDIALLGVVIAGIEGVLGIIAANSQTSTPAAEAAAKAAEAKIQVHAPAFTLGKIEQARAKFLGDTSVAANHYKHIWTSTAHTAGRPDLADPWK